MSNDDFASSSWRSLSDFARLRAPQTGSPRLYFSRSRRGYSSRLAQRDSVNFFSEDRSLSGHAPPIHPLCFFRSSPFLYSALSRPQLFFGRSIILLLRHCFFSFPTPHPVLDGPLLADAFFDPFFLPFGAPAVCRFGLKRVLSQCPLLPPNPLRTVTPAFPSRPRQVDLAPMI